MSTAVMPQSAMYDFGDIMLRNVSGSQHGESGGGGVSGNHLAVGAPPLSPRKFRFALSRMSSSPATATASLVTSLLDNLSLQHRRLERTQSAPAPSQAAVAASAVAAAAACNTSRYKTELCRPYEEFGVCKYGDKCQFAHGAAELRSLARHPKYKTELCRTFHTVGFCPYGPRCHFVHNEEEARQHNRAVAAALMKQAQAAAAAAGRSGASLRPSALSPALSLDSPSPSSSLSQSPTTSMSSFFSSEPELHSPGGTHGRDSPTAASPTVLTAAAAAALHHHHQQQHAHQHQQPPQQLPHCPPASPASDSQNAEFRLPVFNRLAASAIALSDLML